MLITIPDILNAGELDEVRDLLAKTAWSDGRKTAGPEAAKVKRNEQADLSSRTGATLHTKLNDAIRKNAVFQAAAQPEAQPDPESWAQPWTHQRRQPQFQSS